MTEPRFDELPIIPKLGLRHSWDHFGQGDELGTLNRLTPETVRTAALEIVGGDRISLSAPLSQPDPPSHGREPYRQTFFAMNRNTWDEKLDGFYPQCSTQWDGFRHVRCREFGYYGGVLDDPVPATDRLSIHHWSDQGVVGRGVLVDVRRHSTRSYDPFDFVTFSVDDLMEVLDRQNTVVRPGDILCIRFGWWERYRQTPASQWHRIATDEALPVAGLLSDESMTEQLWDWGVAAVAADNPTVEAMPGDPSVGSLHRRALACLGMPLGEYFDFEALSHACADDNRYSFFFSSAPLAIVGGIGAPANALALR
ncbi:cyclase family protein [Rhodococcus koreensis]